MDSLKLDEIESHSYGVHKHSQSQSFLLPNIPVIKTELSHEEHSNKRQDLRRVDRTNKKWL